MARLIRIDVDGINDVRDKVDAMSRRKLRSQVNNDIKQGVEEMAENSYQRAPVETGALRNSILASVKKEGWAEFIYGSHLPYAQRQEYEHIPRKGYFRKSIWAETPEIEAKLMISIQRFID